MPAETKITTNLGRVSIVPKGKYDPAETYSRLDAVEYEGRGYLARRSALQGVSPGDGPDWMLFAEKGEPGTSVQSIALTEGGHAPGTLDTYTITLDNGQETAFQVYNGADGVSVESVALTAGNHAPGTLDTYTIRLDNGEETTIQVYNGADGSGAGDMRAAVYDPQGKNTDIFQYVDDALSGVDLTDYYTKEQTDEKLAAVEAPVFAEADSRDRLGSGEKLPVLFGKIMKWFADLKKVAFSGAYGDLSGAPTALKNPAALRFTGAVSGAYDGSEAVNVRIPDAPTLESLGAQAQHKPLTVTLTAESWFENTQSVTANGVTASNTVFVSPAVDSFETYAESGIRCTAQGNKQLTFMADEVPSAEVTVNVLILN